MLRKERGLWEFRIQNGFSSPLSNGLVFPGSGRFGLWVLVGEKEREKRKGKKEEEKEGGVNEKERVGIVTIETKPWRAYYFDLLTNCLTFSIEGCGFFLEIRYLSH